MLLPGSRYEPARAFDGPFPGLRPRPVGRPVGAVEHTVRPGDRLDALARHYYDDGRLWWRIVDANPGLLCGADLVRETDEVDAVGNILNERMVGAVLLIPRARD